MGDIYTYIYAKETDRNKDDRRKKNKSKELKLTTLCIETFSLHLKVQQETR